MRTSEEIKREIESLKADQEVLQQQVKPMQDQIEASTEQARPFWHKIFQMEDQIGEMRYELQAAESKEFVERLKVGDEIWILASPYHRGRYDTITQERASERFARRADGSSIPHRIAITEIRRKEDGRPQVFIAVEGNKASFAGHVREHSFGVIRHAEGKEEKLWQLEIQWWKT